MYDSIFIEEDCFFLFIQLAFLPTQIPEPPCYCSYWGYFLIPSFFEGFFLSVLRFRNVTDVDSLEATREALKDVLNLDGFDEMVSKRDLKRLKASYSKKPRGPAQKPRTKQLV